MSSFIHINWTEFLALAGAHFIAVASPGPDFAIVTKNALRYGRSAGRRTALGVGIAILLHVSYAIAGFSLLVQTNASIFQLIKYLGAIFLLYLGIMSLRAKPVEFNEEHRETYNKRAFLEGFLTNAFNIKAFLFFLFLFTTIVQRETALQTKLVYGVWLALFTFVWFYIIASIMSIEQVRQFYHTFGIWLDRLMGIVLIGLAISLFLFK